MSQRRRVVRQYLVSTGQAVAIALVLRAVVAEAYVIPSESMMPALQVGDRIFANKLPYGLNLPFADRKLIEGREPKPGEIVVFSDPNSSGETIVKRVVAVGGQRVAMRRGQLVVDGRPVPRRALPGSCLVLADTAGRRWLPDPCRAFEERLGQRRYVVFEGVLDSFGPLTVPEGHFFMLGDNRGRSGDSRYWGPVPFERIKGRAAVTWWAYNGVDGLRWARMFEGL